MTIAKRWVAVAGVLCFLDVAVVGIFFERIFRYLPVTSANLCAYQLAGLIRHDADRSDVKDLVATWKRICPDILVALVVDGNGRVVLGNHGLYESLSATENMRLFAGLLLDSAQLGEHRIREMLTLTGLWDRRNDRVAGFSKGMKQQLAVARALLNNPRWRCVLCLGAFGLTGLAATRVPRERLSGVLDWD
ncbi:MAG: hypothetical protein QME92_09720 [Bacillota bacterium]|nr:hypothetical protein [Bacillota bacterium]